MRSPSTRSGLPRVYPSRSEVRTRKVGARRIVSVGSGRGEVLPGSGDAPPGPGRPNASALYIGRGLPRHLHAVAGGRHAEHRSDGARQTDTFITLRVIANRVFRIHAQIFL